MGTRWNVTAAILLLAATVAMAAGGNRPLLDLPTVAVMPFDDAVIGGDCHWSYNARRWGPGAGVADLIVNELAGEAERWRTFRVVERDRLFEVLDEQDLGRDGRIDPATAARVGKILGADLLVMGAVTRFDVRSDYIGLPRRMGFDAERHEATVAFDARLVDSTTAEIIARARGHGDETSYGATICRGDLAGLDFGSRRFAESMLGKAAREAARSLARKIAVSMDERLAAGCDWLSEADALVVYAERRDGRWWPMINRGARDGVHEGDRLVIKRKRQDVHDPITGELLKTIWDEIGVMTVREVDEKVASGPLEHARSDDLWPDVGDVAMVLERN